MQNASDVAKRQSLAAYVEQLWGTKVRLVPLATVAVLTSSTKVCNNNPRRFGLTIINQGTGTVYLDFGEPAVLSQGFVLTPQGGSLTLTALEDGEMCGYDAYAIAAAAGNNLSVYEIQAV